MGKMDIDQARAQFNAAEQAMLDAYLAAKSHDVNSERVFECFDRDGLQTILAQVKNGDTIRLFFPFSISDVVAQIDPGVGIFVETITPKPCAHRWGGARKMLDGSWNSFCLDCGIDNFDYRHVPKDKHAP